MSAEAIAMAGVGVALLAVLVPLLLALGRRMDRSAARIDALAAEVRRDLHALAEACRPHRPTNGRYRVTCHSVAGAVMPVRAARLLSPHQPAAVRTLTVARRQRHTNRSIGG